VPAASILDLGRSMPRLSPFADLGRELLDLCQRLRQASRGDNRRVRLRFPFNGTIENLHIE
jgi:hypothetical protein